MALDTSSFPAFLRSLNLEGPVTSAPGRIISGPPAFALDVALRLGLGRVIFDTARNRAIMANLGIAAEFTTRAAHGLHSRDSWRGVWEDLAAPHLAAVEEALAHADNDRAVREARAALALLSMAYGGDGYYFATHMRERRKVLPTTRHLYDVLRQATGERVERITITHPHGTTTGLLHFPPVSGPSPKRWPALVGLHPVAGDKDSFDLALALYRAVGYVTLCVDLPAHGENFDGPRLQPDDEMVGVAALDMLAAHPEIDAERLGVTGGSLGAFFALRTAAASSRAKACLVHASPFDIGASLHLAVPGIQDHIAWVMGAASQAESYRMAKPFHLHEAIGKITCPTAAVHGTQDHICDFTAAYSIARGIKAPFTLYPLVGVDHEAALPATPALAASGVAWLRQNL
jgi:naringenin degradation protein FdeB